MGRKIGEIFKYNGEWYQCVKGDICTDCAFAKKHCNENPLFEARGSCKYYRKDATSVIFKKLEKVGEPIVYMSRTFQRLKLPDTEQCKYCYFRNQVCNPQLCGKETFLVEVKQNKEDMEESVEEKLFCDKVAKANAEYMKVKLNSSLKPFDLEAAKAGKPVCTRDGRKARIICFDRNSNKPIVALITTNDREYLTEYYCDGRISHNSSESNDLMMLPEKKEGWVNVYKGNMYDTESEAKKAHVENGYIDTIKIEWEE